MATANLLQTSVSGGTQNALALQGDGVFFPKASTTSRLALTLTTTDKGFIVYDTTDNNIYFWNGTAWESIPGSGDAGANGSVQYNDNGTVSGATNFVWDKVNGRVGIGTATPLSKLQSVGTVSITDGASSGAANGLHLRFDTAINTGYISAFHAGVDNRDLIYDARTHVWQLASGTGLSLNTAANLVLKGGTAAANGVGVTFPATQVASSDANCLDDYEEGVWAPTITAETGTIGATVVNSANYTKVGRLVSVTFDITITSVGTGTAGLKVSLPFSPSVAGNTCGAGREYLNTGFMCQVFKFDATNVLVYNYANVTIISAGNKVMAGYTYFV